MKPPVTAIRNSVSSILTGIILLLFSPPAEAATISLSFSDPSGDSLTSSGDLSGLEMTFDNATGNYTVVLSTVAGAPFVGAFRINVNLFNPDTGTTNPNPSYFQDVFNDFNLAVPAAQIVLTGTNSRLTSWEVGDRVAANNFPFGNPDGTSSFRTELREIATATNRDSLGLSDETNFTLIMPEPSRALLALIGFGIVSVRRRRRR